MGQGSRRDGEADGAAMAPPTWAHGIAALAGLVLLMGPLLAALWPS
jgi:hypothetical protein